MITVYPHEDLPLLPKVLINALGVEYFKVSNGEIHALNELADLEYCKSLSKIVHNDLAQQINKLVQKICYGRLNKGRWGEITLDIPNEVSVSDLKLTNRALVSLQNIPFFGRNGQWRSAKIKDLIGERANHMIGARLMLALLLAVEDFKTNQNFYITLKNANDRDKTLEEQVVNLVKDIIHSHRTLEIFLSVNGWVPEGKVDLNDIAKRLNITHERARQIRIIADEAFEKTPINRFRTYVLSSAEDLISKNSPMLLDDASKLLIDSGITKTGFGVEALVMAYKKFKLNSSIEIIQVDGQKIVCRKDHSDGVKFVRKMIRQKVRELGIIDVESTRHQVAQMPDQQRAGIPADRVRQVFNFACFNLPGWVFLDSEEKWGMVTIGSHGEDLFPRGVVTKMARMAYYFGGIKLSVAQQMFLRRNLLWPPEIIISLCLRSNIKIRPIAGDWMIESKGSVIQKAGENLMKTAEFAIAEMLSNHPEGLKRQELVELGQAQGINKSTIFAVIRNSTLLYYSDELKRVILLLPKKPKT